MKQADLLSINPDYMEIYCLKKSSVVTQVSISIKVIPLERHSSFP